MPPYLKTQKTFWNETQDTTPTEKVCLLQHFIRGKSIIFTPNPGAYRRICARAAGQL